MLQLCFCGKHEDAEAASTHAVQDVYVGGGVLCGTVSVCILYGNVNVNGVVVVGVGVVVAVVTAVVVAISVVMVVLGAAVVVIIVDSSDVILVAEVVVVVVAVFGGGVGVVTGGTVVMASQFPVQYDAHPPLVALHKQSCSGGHWAINCSVTHVPGTRPSCMKVP